MADLFKRKFVGTAGIATAKMVDDAVYILYSGYVATEARKAFARAISSKRYLDKILSGPVIALPPGEKLPETKVLDNESLEAALEIMAEFRKGKAGSDIPKADHGTLVKHFVDMGLHYTNGYLMKGYNRDKKNILSPGRIFAAGKRYAAAKAAKIILQK